MSRLEYQRTSSTNLGTGGSSRPLEGKLAIVTGSSRGIGAAIARNLASKGASLVLNYTSDKSAEITTNLARDLESTYNIQTLGVQADLGDEKGPAHLVNFAKNHFSHPRSGKFQIDILINNAGVSKNLLLEEITADNEPSLNNVVPVLLHKHLSSTRNPNPGPGPNIKDALA